MWVEVVSVNLFIPQANKTRNRKSNNTTRISIDCGGINFTVYLTSK